MTVFLNLSVLALAFAGSCAAIEKRDLKSLQSHYDYIVVGGGVSGLVVANRLTEDANSAFGNQNLERFDCSFAALTWLAETVLVVEYGEQAHTPNASVPGFALSKDQSARTWRFPSVPQTHLANRSVGLPVGSVVGGGSVINGMTYTRGSAADYDSWEALGNAGWNWKNLFPYFRKSTSFTPQEKFIDEYGFEYTPEAYGTGPLQVGFASWQWPASS
jgi:choline dehydrogenase-like flavoprotein